MEAISLEVVDIANKGQLNELYMAQLMYDPAESCT